ncbi:hypothetical protein PRZ48_003676 [Zasmidium cellare]|uniref:D-xylose 1-dehydrogenase (NADP(+), D-xylono-1,5-lactone-forming) n=1 Tax=Zasmidium cellare TaxID=395010 RepID=A0ABR0EVR2_ZASCE|nr:hypothetical protein PRZ48_003676 [Zasmidium cellare]
MSWIGQAMLGFNNWYHGVNKIKATLKKEPNALRIGILSAAAINYTAFIDPVSTHPGAIIVAIGARDKSKAQAQIDSNNLGATCKAYGSYDEVLNDQNVDAVYIPLPNGLHAEWTIKALKKGKHVLVEKAITSNAAECREIQKVSSETGKLALEAFHYRFHPAVHRVKEIVESGTYGAPTAIFTRMSVLSDALPQNDIRFQYGLGGGACLDLSYVFSAACYFGTSLPDSEITVQTATPRIHKLDRKIDEAIDATFTIDSPGSKPPVKCHVSADLNVPYLWGFIPRYLPEMPFLSIDLQTARIEFKNFVIPTFGHSIVITEKDGRKTTEKVYVDGPVWGKRGEVWWSSYRFQLEAFVEGCRKGKGEGLEGMPWVGLRESEGVMGVIDSVYERMGLPVRGL